MERIIIQQDSIKYMQLTKDKLKDAIEIGRKSFFTDETICKAIDLKNNITAMDELQELFIKAARDGVSTVAIDQNTDNLVAASFNKLHVKNQPDIEYYESYADGCVDPASKSFLSFMKGTDLIVDLFEHCQADCYIEIMFLGVSQDYRGRSIAYNLCKASEITAQALLCGRNVRQSITREPLGLENAPKFIGAIFTSSVSQKIGRKLGMKVAATVSLNEWIFKGQTYAERLGNSVASIEYQYKMLVKDGK